MEEKRSISKVREGMVVSNKMDQTVIVSIVTKVKDRDYGKFVKKTKKFFAHDADNQCNIGDIVEIVETRPLSKNKRWNVRKIVKKTEE